MLAESLFRFASRTLTPTYRLVLSHMAPIVTVLLGVPMVVLLTVWARFQPLSLSWPLMTGAPAVLLASTVPAAAVAILKGLNRLSIRTMHSAACHCLKDAFMIVSPQEIGCGSRRSA